MKHYEVIFNPDAVEDIDRLFALIARESNFEVADQYLGRIEKSCFSLRTFPQRGTSIPSTSSALRRIGFERRISILFQVSADHVEILRILYGGQKWAGNAE